MPNRTCDICNRPVTVKQSNWGLVNYKGTFACSKACVLVWIACRPVSVHVPLWVENAAPIRSGTRGVEFKSNFESRFAQWLDRQRFKWSYEAVGWEVGDSKIYIPDFLLHDRWCLLETKGRWSLGQKTKMSMFVDQYPDIPLLVIPWITQKEFREERHEPRLTIR